MRGELCIQKRPSEGGDDNGDDDDGARIDGLSVLYFKQHDATKAKTAFYPHLDLMFVNTVDSKR